MSIKKIELKEGFTLSAEASVQIGLFFELSEKVKIGGTVTNSENIELILDSNESRYLTGFRITVNNTDDETMDQAMEQAKRLTDYLSFVTNTVVRHKRPIIRKKKNGKTETTKPFTADAILAAEFDLDVRKLAPLLGSDSKLNQCLAHYQDGLKSLLDNDFPQSIKDFFLIIENTGIPEEVRYKSLRDAVSHNMLEHKNTLEALKNEFGIPLKKGEYLNINVPNIQAILETEAGKLRNVTRNYLSSYLK
jgi:hypothetical protein